jgi:hypothetical protein
MRMDYDSRGVEELVMDDGTRYYAHAHIVGLSPDGEICYGYDGELASLSLEHKKELAKYMIDLWTKVLNAEVPL